MAHAAVNAFRPFFNDCVIRQIAAICQQAGVVRPDVEPVKRACRPVNLQKRNVPRANHRVESGVAQQFRQIVQWHVRHIGFGQKFGEHGPRNIHGVSLRAQFFGKMSHRLFGSAERGTFHLAVIPRGGAVSRKKQNVATGFKRAFGVYFFFHIARIRFRQRRGYFNRKVIKRVGRNAVVNHKLQVLVGQRRKCVQRLRGHMPYKKSQVEYEIAQVPRTECAMLGFKNCFVHANAALAISHPIRHNDHVIRNKESGLVRFHKQFARVVRGGGHFDHAIITVCHFVHVFAAVMHQQRIHALHALHVVCNRFNQIEKPVLLLSQRLVALIHVEARHVLLLHPVVLRQRDFIPPNRVLVAPVVAIAVGAIERVALVQIVPLGKRFRVRLFQNDRIVQILVGVPVARPAASRNNVIIAIQYARDCRRRFLTTDVFVQHGKIFEPFAIIYQLGARVVHARCGVSEF